VKRNAQVGGLVADLRKLRDYIKKCAEVNYGVVLYFSSVQAREAVYREHRAISERSSTMGRKLAIVWVAVPRRRIPWGSPES
jgi:hypothetical protein